MEIEEIKRKLLQLSPMKIIFWGYCLIILAGSALLMLPCIHRRGKSDSVSGCTVYSDLCHLRDRAGAVRHLYVLVDVRPDCDPGS